MSEETKQIDDGGPAFPTQNTSPGYCGMSLRDYFAAKAMQAIVGCFHKNKIANGEKLLDDEQELWDSVSCSEFDRDMGIDNGAGTEEIATDAYAIADAMIAARKGK